MPGCCKGVAAVAALGAAAAGYVPCVDGECLRSGLRAAASNAWVQAAVAVGLSLLALRALNAKRKKAAFLRKVKEDNAKGRVYIYVPISRTNSLVGKGLTHFNPNTVKIEAFLRLHKIPYEFVVDGDAPSMSPTGTVPMVAVDGELVGDSEVVMEFLARRFNKPLYEDDKQLQGATTQALVAGLRRMTEWHLIPQWARFFLVDHAKTVVVPMFAETTGYPEFMVNLLVSKTFRPATIERLNKSSLGWQSDARCQEEFLRDLKALEALLRENGEAFLLTADQPTAADCLIFPQIAVFVAVGGLPAAQDSLAMRYASESPVLTAYVKRVAARLFPDLEELKTKPYPQRFF